MLTQVLPGQFNLEFKMILNHQKFVVTLTVFFCFVIALNSGCNSPVPVAESGSNPSTDMVVEQADKAKEKAVKSDAGSDVPNTTGSMPAMGGMKKMKFPAPEDMKFKDQIESNVEPPETPSELSFINRDGSKLELASYKGKQNVILVFTEGFNGMLCPFCQTQTSRLVANYKEFQNRDCEVIVVYPGPRDHLDEFVEAALKTEKQQLDRVPFPIVLDPEFSATEYFGIRSKLAHPSTYLIDKEGGVQFAYVGTDMTADRPSISALIKKLDELK